MSETTELALKVIANELLSLELLISDAFGDKMSKEFRDTTLKNDLELVEELLTGDGNED